MTSGDHYGIIVLELKKGKNFYMKVIAVLATKGMCLYCGKPTPIGTSWEALKFCDKRCQGHYDWINGKSQLMAKSRVGCFNPKAIPQYHPDLTPSENLSYILGVLRSDGSVNSRHSIRLSSRNKEFADRFALAMNSIGLPATVRSRSRKSRFSPMVKVIYISGVKSVTFSKWYMNLDDIKIKDIALGFPKDFLRGFYEGDGIASSVGFCNSNINKLELARDCLLKLGFNPPEPKKYLDPELRPDLLNKKPMYRFLLGKPAGRAFLKLIEPCIKLGGAT